MTTEGENLSLSLYTRSKLKGGSYVAKGERIKRLERHAKVVRKYEASIRQTQKLINNNDRDGNCS